MSETSTDTIRIPIDTIRVNIPGLKETGTFYSEDAPDVLCVECEPEHAYTGPCLKCGCIDSYKANGFADVRRIHDVSIGIYAVDLYFKGRRYKCRDCGGTFGDPVDFAKSGYWMTNRLIETIQRESVYHTFTTVARKYGISISWVQRIFMEHAKEFEDRRVVKAPEVLGIDEVHICDQMRLVLTDSENGILLDMYPGNTKQFVKRAIESMEGYENIKYVTIDMATGYRNTVERMLPNAMIIVDRFHVVRYISSASQSAKKEIVERLKLSVDAMEDGPDKIRKQNLLTRLGKKAILFKYNNQKIKEDSVKSAFLMELCMEFPELDELYQVKINAENIYDISTTAEEALENFKTFKKSIPARGKAYKDFRDFAKMFENWEPEILNYFRSGRRLTNAATEGLNSDIKSINNSGKGYSFKVLRAKCLINQYLKGKSRNLKSRKKLKQ